jgi:uncharacterized protein (TIGR03435 family)
MTVTFRLGFFLMAATAWSQPSFEVASIKPAAPVTGHFQYHMTMNTYPDRVELKNASLVDLIRTAYQVKPDQVSGPAWMSSEKFDVLAKLPDGSTPDQIPQMLQGLLASRFHLAIHRGSAEHAGLALLPGKAGPKLTASPPDPDDTKGSWTRTPLPDGALRIDTRKMTLSALADLLANFLGCPVRDLTATPGTYDMPMDFSAEDLRAYSQLSGTGAPADSPAASVGSAIFDSVQRLGLRLEKRKFPVELIVVDHLDKAPAEN